MTYDECQTRRKRLISLIKQENTGTAKELSKKLCCSRSTVMRDIVYLRDNNYPVTYNRYKRSFCYSQDMRCKENMKNLSKDDLFSLKGGKNFARVSENETLGTYICHRVLQSSFKLSS